MKRSPLLTLNRYLIFDPGYWILDTGYWTK
jgi:hypothetical protein